MTKPYQSAAELVASVKTLLTLPEVYLQVKAVVEDPDACLSDLVNAIAIDQGITARTLKLVNSAYFHVNHRVDNLRQAVNLLGMQAIHDLVLATTLTGIFSKAHLNRIDMRSFWTNSVRRGIYSRLLAKSIGIRDHERLFLEGLLSNIGDQVIGIQLPQQMLSMQHLSLRSGQPLHQLESESLGFNYAEVGGELMIAWKMPDNITEVVSHHLNPGLADRFKQDAAIVHVAQALSALEEKDIVYKRPDSIVDADTMALAGLAPEILTHVVEQAKAEIETTTCLLLGTKEAA